VVEALYDSAAMRRFVGIDLGQKGAPDETTVCKFRHLLEKHGLADPLFAAVSEHLKRHGLKLSQGTIVDATIIAAASSTKNKGKTRDAEMHQTKKGNQWHFGMKAHIGVDEAAGLVHTVVSTAANVVDITEVANLLHGKERHVFGDGKVRYKGLAKNGAQVTTLFALANLWMARRMLMQTT